MAKVEKFKKVEFEMVRDHGYNAYLIIGKYRGKDIQVRTNDSEAWDYLDDDSNKEKRDNARKYCYLKIVEEYNRLYEKH